MCLAAERGGRTRIDNIGELVIAVVLGGGKQALAGSDDSSLTGHQLDALICLKLLSFSLSKGQHDMRAAYSVGVVLTGTKLPHGTHRAQLLFLGVCCEQLFRSPTAGNRA